MGDDDDMFDDMQLFLQVQELRSLVKLAFLWHVDPFLIASGYIKEGLVRDLESRQLEISTLPITPRSTKEKSPVAAEL